ncbi:Transmembrane protein 18 [Plasmodiophora brassicae]|uniref:Uncharacterized protein n=1 Tax=Plasmodiophora brassicae TaxID=37360 RepID=A0A0G4IJT0_PLABS|nr:hypothetical protein PBRA_004150 [Plasmodiophora brassicae]
MSSADAAAEYWASLASAMKESLNAEASGIWHTLRRFAAVVDWTEPFVLAIVAAVTAIAAFAVLTRRRCDIQAALLVLIGAVVWASKPLNAYANKTWSMFATQPYFDESGQFLALMVGVPLLLVATFIVVNALYQASRLLIKVKRAEHKAARGPKKVD